MTAPQATSGKKGPAPKSGFSQIRRSYLLILGLGLVLLAASVVGTVAAPVFWTAFAIPFLAGCLFTAFGRWGLRIGSTMTVLSSSHNQVQAGRLAEAEAQLDALSGNRARAVRSAVHYQRAMIAARRGDLARVDRELTAMLALPKRWMEGANGDLQRAAAHGLRAWARAATGDLDGARSDIEEVRISKTPGSAALAHASLAEALMLERAGDRAALAALLRREGKLLLGGLEVRERSVIRAMQRMLRAPATSVYRTRVDPKKLDDKEEPPIAEWVERVTPELAPFLPRLRIQGSSPAPRFEPSAKAANDAQKTHDKKPASLVARVAGLWLVLIGLYYAIWQLLSPGQRPRGRSRGAPVAPLFSSADFVTFAGVFMGAVLAIAILRVVLVVARSRRNTRRLLELEPAVARGEDVSAALAELAKVKQETAAAQAEAMLGALHDRRGDAEQALRHCDAARAKLRTRAGQAAAAGILSPTITGNRAYMLAALGRADEAYAELGHLPPDYLFLDRMRFVVPLVALLAKGEIDAAGRLVDATSPDLGVGPRDELMRDLVHAVTSPTATGAAEIARLREELRDRDEHRRWIQKFAPTLLTRFEQTVAGSGESGTSDEEEAEREAAAEQEAQTDSRARQRT